MFYKSDSLRPRAVLRAAVTFTIPLLGLAACDMKAPESATPGLGETLTPVTTGLATPESVLWDAERDLWYVSNINGSPTAEDGNGYIIRLNAEGAMMDSLPFLNGADDDIELNAPKGMALIGDTLWVADIRVVRAFDVNTGTTIKSFDLTGMGATFLNDVAIGADSSIYITDSGIAFDEAGNVSHPGASRVYWLQGVQVKEAVRLPQESAANGIAWDEELESFIIVGFNTPSVFTWTPGSRVFDVLGEGPGGGDGIVMLKDGRALYSSWADSSLTLFSKGVSKTLRQGLPAPADIGYDPDRGIIAVPLFTSDRIEFFKVQ